MGVTGCSEFGGCSRAARAEELPHCVHLQEIARIPAEATLVQFSKDSVHCLLQRGQISGDNIPDCLKVHFKIVVYQDVSHAGYRRPVDLGVALLVRFVDPLCRLTEHLKVADNGVLERA